MNKITAVAFSSIMLMSSSFASPLLTLKKYKKYHDKTPFSTPTNAQPVNFSGVWAGLCLNETLKINIQQSREEVLMTFSYENDESDHFKFKLNQFEANSASTKNSAEATVRYARLENNTLELVEHTNFIETHGRNLSIEEDSLHVDITKNDNTITISDDEGDSCTLSKIK